MNMNNVDSQASNEHNEKSILYTLGIRLRAAREEKKLTISVIADELCIRRAYIEAFEKGDWSKNSGLPAGVYAQGFFRQYADYLGIILTDAELLAVRQVQELEEHVHVFRQDPPIAPRRYWVWLTALGLLSAIIYFNVYYTEEQPNIEPQVNGNIIPELLESETLVRKKNSNVEYIAPQTKQDSKVDTYNHKQINTLDNKQTNDNYSSDRYSENITQKTIKQPVIDSSIIEFTALGAAVWFSIHSVSGKKLGERLLKDGQTWQYNVEYLLKSAKQNGVDGVLILNCGNASPLEIKRGDVVLAAAGSLGAQGKVLRNYRLVIRAANLRRDSY
ncbi:MAG: helix-turn-helix domain-containing protein [Mariprofundales bacterium]